jgi:hypothetical protein
MLLSCALAGCNQVMNEAARPSHDKSCMDALAHVTGCDGRFPDRTELCGYSAGGSCQPYINAEQGQCLSQSPCDTVRAALDQGDWLCGVSLHGPFATRP